MKTNKVGSLIREKRLAKGMTQKELADKMNLSDKAISKWECGLGNPDVSLLLELSSILEIDSKDLLAGYEKRQAKNEKDGEIMQKESQKELKEKYKNRVRIGGVYCIKCKDTNDLWIRGTKDIHSSKNRFAFSVSMNSCPELCMADQWKLPGPGAFTFEILEEIEKEDTQTEGEFEEDINSLVEYWNEKIKIPEKQENLEQKPDIKRFLDSSGKIVQLPQKQSFRVATLQYLSEKFENNREYTEKEVNEICEEWHTFGDYFLLRRELVDNGLLFRESNGSRYWRPAKE